MADVATGKTHSVKEFLELTFKHAMLDIDKYVEIDPRLFRPHEVPLLLGDSSKARKKLGWEPYYDLPKLVTEMYSSDFKQQCAVKIGPDGFGRIDPLSSLTEPIF